MMRRTQSGGNGCLIAPEVFEPVRRQLGVPDRVLDVLVAEPCLQRPRAMPGISQGVAAGVPQHVRKNGEGHTGAPAEARSNSVPKLLADIGPPRSLVNTYGAASCSRCSRRR